MRMSFRFPFVLLIAGLLIVPAVSLFAQQGAKAGPLTQKAPPLNQQPAQAQQADPGQRLDQILERWEAASSKIKSLHGMQARTEFNPVYFTEMVTKGPFFLEMPDKGRIDFNAVEIKKGAVGKKMAPRAPGGKPMPYDLITDSSKRWICTGEEIVQVDEQEKSYSKQTIPENMRGKNIVESPLPFLFGLKAEEAKRRFKLEIKHETNDLVMILAEPKMAKDLENYTKAAITLDKRTFLPTQVRTIDQSKVEIVYEFSSVKVNDQDIRSQLAKLFNLDKDPFKPNLSRYKLVIPPSAPIDQDIQPIQPAGRQDSTDAVRRTATPKDATPSKDNSRR